MPIWAKYYGEDGELKRLLIFSDYRSLGGRLVPTRLRMYPQDKPEEYTEVLYKELEFDIRIARDTFSLTSLRKSR